MSRCDRVVGGVREVAKNKLYWSFRGLYLGNAIHGYALGKCRGCKVGTMEVKVVLLWVTAAMSWMGGWVLVEAISHHAMHL